MEAKGGGGEGAKGGGMVIIHHSFRTLEVGVGAAGGDIEQRNTGSLHIMRAHFHIATLRVWISISCRAHSIFFLSTSCDGLRRRVCQSVALMAGEGFMRGAGQGKVNMMHLIGRGVKGHLIGAQWGKKKQGITTNEITSGSNSHWLLPVSHL